MRYTFFVEDTIPRPFAKNSKLSKSLDQYSKVLCRFFHCMYVKLMTIENVLKLHYRPLAFTSYKAFSCYILLPDQV